MTPAAQLMTDLQALGVTLAANGDRLRFYPRDAVTGDLLTRLRTCKAELLTMLQPQDLPGGDPLGDAGGADGPQPLAAAPQATTGPRTRAAAPVAVEWPAAGADFALLLAPDDLPRPPFKPNAWTEVRDAGRFLAWLQADIRRGPAGPRAFYGALQADLQALQRFALRAVDDRRPQDLAGPRGTSTERQVSG